MRAAKARAVISVFMVCLRRGTSPLNRAGLRAGHSTIDLKDYAFLSLNSRNWHTSPRALPRPKSIAGGASTNPPSYLTQWRKTYRLEKPRSENVSPATRSVRRRRTSWVPSSTALTAGKRAQPKATLNTDSNKNPGIVWSEASFQEYL